MSPLTHLLASWVIAAKTTDNARDCRLVTLAGILPDVDGLGLIVDLGNQALGRDPTYYYHLYHHYWTHGLPGALVISLILACFAKQLLRVLLLAIIVFHLHLLCDLLGSRGPTVADNWPIFYMGPIQQHPMLSWSGQWRLDGWQNRVICVSLFAVALWMPLKLGHSVVGVFNRRADTVFVGVLRRWRLAWQRRRAQP